MLPIRSRITFAIMAIIPVISVYAQDSHRDRAVLASPKNEFLDSIKTLAARSAKAPVEPKKSLFTDFSQLKLPAGLSEFTQIPHQPPISQALSGMCWAFAGTSFFESEITRLTG